MTVINKQTRMTVSLFNNARQQMLDMLSSKTQADVIVYDPRHNNISDKT